MPDCDGRGESGKKRPRNFVGGGVEDASGRERKGGLRSGAEDFRGEQGAGINREGAGCAGRGEVASHRAPAEEQNPEGAAVLRTDPRGGQRGAGAGHRTGGGRGGVASACAAGGECFRRGHEVRVQAGEAKGGDRRATDVAARAGGGIDGDGAVFGRPGGCASAFPGVAGIAG